MLILLAWENALRGDYIGKVLFDSIASVFILAPLVYSNKSSLNELGSCLENVNLPPVRLTNFSPSTDP